MEIGFSRRQEGDEEIEENKIDSHIDCAVAAGGGALYTAGVHGVPIENGFPVVSLWEDCCSK